MGGTNLPERGKLYRVLFLITPERGFKDDHQENTHNFYLN